MKSPAQKAPISTRRRPFVEEIHEGSPQKEREHWWRRPHAEMPLHTEEALCTETRSLVEESTCRETLCNTQRGDPLKQVSLDRRPILGRRLLWA